MAILAVLLLLFLSSCATGVGEQASNVDSFPLPAPAEELARVALVYRGLGNDVLVAEDPRTVSGLPVPQRLFPDTVGRFALTDRRAPVWSGDGRLVAAVGRMAPSEDARPRRRGRDRTEAQQESVVLTADLSRGVGHVVWRNTARAPFLVSWSPDQRYVAILTVDAGGGLVLSVVAVTASGARDESQPERIVVEGGPIYFDWLGDAAEMVIAAAGSVSVADVASGTIDRLPLDSGAFRAPDSEPDTLRFAAVVVQDRIQRIVRVDESGRAVAQQAAPNGAAVAWNPQGRWLATLRYGGAGPLGALAIVDTQQTTQRVGLWSVQDQPRRADGIALAMEWSPTGEALLVLRANERDAAPNGAVFRWEWYTRDPTGTWTGRSVHSFQPTPVFLQTRLPFFDQYLRLATTIAPDGSAFAFDAIGFRGRPIVFVQPIDGEEPLPVGAGVLPRWRPQQRSPDAALAWYNQEKE
jgi:hypothetical protein